MNNLTIAVNGGNKLSGPITIVANKNAVLPAIASSLLTKETMEYHNVPKSTDVEKMLLTIELMSGKVTKQWPHILINCENLEDINVPRRMDNMQAGYLFVAPLLYRFGKAVVPISSGCNLGYRGPEDHMYYFSELGVDAVINSDDTVTFTPRENFKEDRLNLKTNEILIDRSVTYIRQCVTPTENILMFLAGASKYRTEINGVAQEPHVAQHIDLLRQMGSKIIGKGSTLTIEGTMQDFKGAQFHPDPDHVHYFGAIVECVMTQSDRQVIVKKSQGILHMNVFIKKLGIVIEENDDGFFVHGSQSSYSPDETFPREVKEGGKTIYRLQASPAPGFPVDCIPMFIALSTLNYHENTETEISNNMYTDGLTYVKCLRQMGAEIKYDRNKVVTYYSPRGNPYKNSNYKETIMIPEVIEGCRAVITCALSGGYHILENANYVCRRNPTYIEDQIVSGADIKILG